MKSSERQRVERDTEALPTVSRSAPGRPSALATLLALCRLSNLPTIWSNCLAGWWLGGHRETEPLPWLLLGASFLYLGGAFLNDAFDADHDRQHGPWRPIPSGAVQTSTVWRWGLGWLVAGTLTLLWLGPAAGDLGLALVVLIILANAVPRLIAVSPVLLGLCRLVLYLAGAVVAGRGMFGWALWCGLAMAAYTTGIGYFARWQATPRHAPLWPAALLIVPIPLALLMNADAYRESGLLLAVVLALWGLRAVRHTFWSPQPNVSQTVSGLAAGIVWVDWLAAADAPRELGFVFVGLFLLTILLQRTDHAASNSGLAHSKPQ